MKPKARAIFLRPSHSSFTRWASSRPAATRRSYQRFRSCRSSVFEMPPGEDDRVHRELLDAEVGVEEMEGEDEARGEQRLVGVEDEGDVDHPAGQEAGEELREPHDQAGGADDEDAPEYGEIVEALPVGPAVELRPRPLPKNHFWWATKSRQSWSEGTIESGPKSAAQARRSRDAAGSRVAQRARASSRALSQGRRDGGRNKRR